MLLLLEFKHVRQSAPADYKGASLSGKTPCQASIADGQNHRQGQADPGVVMLARNSGSVVCRAGA
jgi:hypothetical protein